MYRNVSLMEEVLVFREIGLYHFPSAMLIFDLINRADLLLPASEVEASGALRVAHRVHHLFLLPLTKLRDSLR